MSAGSAGGSGLAAAVGSILGAVGGLDALKENMQIRRESAAKQAKALGPRTSGAAGRSRGVSLHWHGSKSFLEQNRGNV